MKRVFAFLLVMVLCLSCVSVSFADTPPYDANYVILAGKEGYSPSTIYHKSAGGYTAKYHLISYTIDSNSYDETIKVHMWNRQLGKQVTSRLAVSVSEEISLTYLTKPTSSQTLKPVTYKTNTDHYSKDVALVAKFTP